MEDYFMFVKRGNLPITKYNISLFKRAEFPYLELELRESCNGNILTSVMCFMLKECGVSDCEIVVE